MNYSVEILPQALDNIESAYRWIANNHSSERAEQWYEELMTAVRSLSRFPNRASQAPEAAEIELDIRQLFVGKKRQYRVLSVVDKERVSILYVRHTSQSWLSE
ncbi:type II toxin-antitoxin system RelE/ParE family toxin [Chamaesiphon polymorphus]|uniref:Type II toxin-antitoxin system RelE/ParE family toxin n=1 Tax=Chamaesiphon polymorphus CCALA 037 TaxID=2107692 RepID=A0A2T1GDL6_9CYAN|nr:type II toxin-antitoxin system RelE/ParE family toxin [Chamaesiphon polymorphus]PSB55474.1 type II toxin-antitoxin system RelE/ParE family toxin [Chamaesiphon polymorphus CCALA 037]